MTSSIILKKSSIAERVPVTGDLAYGELALNYADGALYYKRSDNTIQNLIPASGGGGGSGGEFTATANGAITAGKPVILNNDGTVSDVGISGTAAKTGTEVTINSANSNFSDQNIFNGFMYNSNTNYGMFMFSDGASGFATRIRGYYVNPTTNAITVGSSKFTVLNGGYSYYAYMHSPLYSNGIVLYQTSAFAAINIATVSISNVDSITYGTASTLLDGTNSPLLGAGAVSYTTYKGVAFYKETSNLWYLRGFDFTGGTFTVGSSQTVVTNAVPNPTYKRVIPLNNNRFLLYYGEASAGTKYVAIAEVASDNSVTLGTVLSVGSTYFTDLSFDPTTNKAIAISSTSVSDGSIYVFDCSSNNISLLATNSVTGQNNFTNATLRWNTAASRFDWVGLSTATNKISVIQFIIESTNTVALQNALTTLGTSTTSQIGVPLTSNGNIIPVMQNDYSIGKALAWSDAVYTTNADSYIGIAKAAASNATTATVQITGSINTEQTGLTIGTSYFVADDGTLTTTNNGRKIGTAHTTTGLLVNTNLTPSEMNSYLGSLVA